MFSSRFMLFPTLKKKLVTKNNSGGGGGGVLNFFQIVDIGNFITRLEILKSSPSLTG